MSPEQENFYQQTHQLIEYSVLGEEVRQFLQSDIGKFIQLKIERERNDGFSILKKVAPSDTAAITSAQNMVWRAESLLDWMQEAISTGLQAMKALNERNEEG